MDKVKIPLQAAALMYADESLRLIDIKDGDTDHYYLLYKQGVGVIANLAHNPEYHGEDLSAQGELRGDTHTFIIEFGVIEKIISMQEQVSSDPLINTIRINKPVIELSNLSTSPSADHTAPMEAIITDDSLVTIRRGVAPDPIEYISYDIDIDVYRPIIKGDHGVIPEGNIIIDAETIEKCCHEDPLYVFSDIPSRYAEYLEPVLILAEEFIGRVRILEDLLRGSGEYESTIENDDLWADSLTSYLIDKVEGDRYGGNLTIPNTNKATL